LYLTDLLKLTNHLTL